MEVTEIKFDVFGFIVAMANSQVIDGKINTGFEERVSDFRAISDGPFGPER